MTPFAKTNFRPRARPIQGQIGAIFFAATPAPVKLIIELFTKSSEAQPG